MVLGDNTNYPHFGRLTKRFSPGFFTTRRFNHRETTLFFSGRLRGFTTKIARTAFAWRHLLRRPPLARKPLTPQPSQGPCFFGKKRSQTNVVKQKAHLKLPVLKSFAGCVFFPFFGLQTAAQVLAFCTLQVLVLFIRLPGGPRPRLRRGRLQRGRQDEVVLPSAEALQRDEGGDGRSFSQIDRS